MSKSSKAEDPNKIANPTDDVSQPNASCSAACTITSETVKEKPINRARTRIGAGELVKLTVSPESATWTATPNSFIKFIGDANKASNSITIQALDKAGDVTITAKSGACECSITLTIVLPTTISMERIPGTPIEHVQGLPSCGWQGRAIITPNDVNFSNIHLRELNDQFTGTGSFAVFTGVWHGSYGDSLSAASDWINVYYDARQKNVGNGTDRIYSGSNPGAVNPKPPPPFIAGRLHTIIRWQWTINKSGTTHHDFPAFDQLAVSDGNGTCTQSKGGHSETSLVNDPTSG